ncbi:hypothetical protein B5F54_00165 [Anaeromassilibacillus sp. An250]|nr:hypothetical protein B5F54_00165 [Anaeromassilibacillus sp. An250]
MFPCLTQNTGRVLTFIQIYEHIRKEPDYGTGREIVNHHVYRVRCKLNLGNASDFYIRSVRGIGYSLEVR